MSDKFRRAYDRLGSQEGHEAIQAAMDALPFEEQELVAGACDRIDVRNVGLLTQYEITAAIGRLFEREDVPCARKTGA